MSIKIVIDMNLSQEWIEVFHKAGWQAIHWSALGAPNAKDELIMAWAVEHQHVVFTHDLDFSAILASTNASAPSLIQLRVQNMLPESLAETVITAVRQFELHLELGAIITIDHSKQRVRILPFE